MAEQTLLDRVKQIPDHIGQSIRITQGYKISLPGPNDTIHTRGKSNGYHRHGFSLELLAWLETHVGITAPQHLWEKGEGDWLHTGSRYAKADSQYRSNLYLDFWIRDRRKAMIFLLVWNGYL